MPAKAAAPVADKQAPSFYRYKVGDIQVTVVSDGRNTFPLEDNFITNAKKEDVNAALEKAFLPRDIMTIYFAPLVHQYRRQARRRSIPATARSPRSTARARPVSSPTIWPPPVSTPRRSTWW